MNSRTRPFSRALLASLPLLGFTLRAKSGLLYGTVVSSVLLSGTLIFIAIQAALPNTLHRLSFLLLLLVLGVIGAELFSLSPLLLVSLLGLLPTQFSPRGENWDRRTGKTLAACFFFWALLAGHGILSELLGLHWGIGFFQFPGGSYFLFGLLLVLMRKP